MYRFAEVKNNTVVRRLVLIAHISMLAIELSTLYYENVPIILQLMCLVLCAIVIGAFNSLIDSDDEAAQEIERLKPKDAYMFPVFGSIVLCSAYIIIKYAPRWLLNFVLRSLFVLVGTFAIESYIDSLVSSILPPTFKAIPYFYIAIHNSALIPSCTIRRNKPKQCYVYLSLLYLYKKKKKKKQ